MDAAADFPESRRGLEQLIAIVDDDQSVREALRGLLHAHGLNAATFASALDFLSSPALGETACLIADVNMPMLTGIELHEQLTRSGRQIPTLLITAYPDDGLRTRALNSGVVAYLLKPFEEDELIGHLLASLER